jgi:hypothetical protein
MKSRKLWFEISRSRFLEDVLLSCEVASRIRAD